MWQGAAVQPLRLVGQQQACVTGNLDRVGEGTSKHSGSLAHVGWLGRPPKNWLEGSQRPRERKGSVRHIQTCSRHRWEGWTRQKANSSSCQAGRWQESSLSFQQGGPACPQRSTGGSSASWAGCSNPQGEGRRAERTIAEERGRWQTSCFFQQRDIVCVVLRREG